MTFECKGPEFCRMSLTIQPFQIQKYSTSALVSGQISLDDDAHLYRGAPLQQSCYSFSE